MQRKARQVFKAKMLTISAIAVIASQSFMMPASASTILPDSKPSNLVITKSTPTHTIFVRCKISPAKISISKGSVLTLPNALKDHKNDFALVTAHGLKEGKDCDILDFHGNRRRVKKRIYAKGHKAGTNTDWAVVSFKPIKGEHIKRYNVDNYVSDIGLLDSMTISFAQARGLPQNNQTCRLAVVKVPMLKNTRSLFTHDCTVISGQSGSPLTQNVNGEDKLIGIHLGHLWTLYSPLTGSPGTLNYMRPFDKNMSDDIKSAIIQLQTK